MTHLAWDECRIRVLACRRYGDLPNEHPPLFSSRPGRTDRACADFSGRAGAIACDAGSHPRARNPCRGSSSCPCARDSGAARHPCSGNPATGRGSPGDAAPGSGPGPDRRSVRRGNHADAEDGGGPQGQRQLGFGVRDADRLVQEDCGPARQAGHQAVRQFDDRLHLDRRQRLYLSRRKFRSTRSRRTCPRTSASAKRPTARR